MLAGEDVETPAWHGRGIEGMLGCSPGAGGRGRGIGLMGGNPGEVCFWPSCGVSLASGSAAGRFGTGASGKVSSAAAISGGSAGGGQAGGREDGGVAGEPGSDRRAGYVVRWRRNRQTRPHPPAWGRAEPICV